MHAMTIFDFDEELDGNSTGGFSDKYEAKEKLGAGISSLVRRCIDRTTGESYAVKIIDKFTEQGGVDIDGATRDEIEILTMLQGHRNIIKLVDVFESSAFFFLVFELADKGELFDHLTQEVTLSEKKARRIMFEILQAVQFMHNNEITHRDLKPENILLVEDNRVKISDFGFAAKLKEEETLRELCGTPGYLAPEVLRCSMFPDAPGYSKEVDIWACGVIMYTLLCGFPPFWHRRQVVMLRSIMEGKYSFHSPEWDDISSTAKDLTLLTVLQAIENLTLALCKHQKWKEHGKLISKLLVVNPKKRLTAVDALQHTWLEGCQISKGKPFCARWKFKGAVYALIAVREFHSLLAGKFRPVAFEAVLREPYGVKPVRKLIDGCAFRIYGHWVKRNKDQNQNRAALFENKPNKERYNGETVVDAVQKSRTQYDTSFRMASFGHFKRKVATVGGQ